MLSRKVRISVLVSGGGTNLQALIDAQNSGIIKSGQIVRVISSREDAYALKRADAAGIPVSVVAKGEYRDRASFESALIREIDSAGAEVIVLAGFMCILSADFTGKYENRILNVHPSLIPSFCGEGYYGLRVHEAALSYGVKVTGATVHFVNEIPDGGKIIMQKAVDISEDDTPETLQKKVMKEAEWVILPRSVELICKQMREDNRDE